MPLVAILPDRFRPAIREKQELLPEAARYHSFSVTADGVKFLSAPTQFRQITDIREYQFGDIRPDDTVIDIGANVGAFCIRAARSTRHVVAVEPVTADILRENIRANEVPVQIIEGALGNGRPVEICWDGRRALVPTFPLRRIIGMAGGCDFLKCDCEGAEWHIDPVDLAGIRRIEIELHQPPIGGPPDPALLDYISRHYDFEITRVPCLGPLGCMGVLHAERRRP
jgi:hypothetical protein